MADIWTQSATIRLKNSLMINDYVNDSICNLCMKLQSFIELGVVLYIRNNC